MDGTAIVTVYATEDPELLRVGSLRRDTRVSETGATLYLYSCLHVLDRIGDRLFLVPHGYSTTRVDGFCTSSIATSSGSTWMHATSSVGEEPPCE